MRGNLVVIGARILTASAVVLVGLGIAFRLAGDRDTATTLIIIGMATVISSVILVRLRDRRGGD